MPPDGHLQDAPLPRDLRFLKLLVATLTGVMILGIATIITLLALRLNVPGAPLPVLPEGIALPEGARPAALTFTPERVIIVTEDGQILIHARDDGRLLERLHLP
jgi:hypothetical protein